MINFNYTHVSKYIYDFREDNVNMGDSLGKGGGGGGEVGKIQKKFFGGGRGHKFKMGEKRGSAEEYIIKG